MNWIGLSPPSMSFMSTERSVRPKMPVAGVALVPGVPKTRKKPASKSAHSAALTLFGKAWITNR